MQGLHIIELFVMSGYIHPGARRHRGYIRHEAQPLHLRPRTQKRSNNFFKAPSNLPRADALPVLTPHSSPPRQDNHLHSGNRNATSPAFFRSAPSCKILRLKGSQASTEGVYTNTYRICLLSASLWLLVSISISDITKSNAARTMTALTERRW